MLKRSIATFAIALSLFVGAGYAVAQSDTQLPPTPSAEIVTPAGVATATPVVITATDAPTLEPTATPVPNPAPGGISSQVLFLVIVTVIGLILTVLLQQKSIHDALVQAGGLIPEWAWIGLKSAGISGLDALQAKARETIETDDDVEVARLRKIAVDTINEIDSRRAIKAQVAPKPPTP